MLSMLCLRILTSLRILRYDLGRQTPHSWGGSIIEGRVASPPPPPLLLFLPPLRIQAWRGCPTPALSLPSGCSPGTPALSLHPQSLIVATVCFLPRCILRSGDPSWHAASNVRPAGRHKHNEQIKFHKLSKVNASKLTLVLSTPPLKGAVPAPGLRLTVTPYFSSKK
jgi:hypothetical protein